MEHIHIHLHPMLVHFPLALFIGAVVMEVLSWITQKEVFHRTAVHMYILAALIAPLAAWTGLDEATEHKLHHPVVTLHRNFALATTWTGLISLPVLGLVYRRSRKAFRILFIVVVLAVAGLVTAAGYNGGRLVYEYGIGVEN